jgi:hypothetical protein
MKSNLFQPEKSFNKNKCYSDFDNSTYPKLDSKKSNIIDVVSFAPFLMWNEHDDKYFQTAGKINTNNYPTTDNYAELMKEAFFSSENMDIIQNRIIYTVFEKSDQTLRINKIKNETLIQIMNQMWSTHCRFLPYNLREQIEDLDQKIIDYAVPLLLQESQFYLNYLRDADRTNLPPLERPIMINKNRKQQLPSYYK